MSKPPKNLTDQLAAAVAPMSSDAAPTKAMTKTLRQLAKQLTKQQSKLAKTAQQPTPLTAKRARKALAGELATALQPYLGADEAPDAKAPKSVSKAVKRLAGQLVKERRKQAKQTVKQAKLDAKQATKAARAAEPDGDETNRPVKAARKPAARPSVAPQARRPAAAKRPTPKAVAPASVGADNE
jgi:small-conductance mechanosensitive channel